jgi:outer membrane lipoprotein SlyB
MDDRNPRDDGPRDTAHHDDDNVAGNLIGEAVGGVSGIAAGMAIGSLGGPIGAAIGGLAGAIGGWWSGRAISEAAHHYTEADDTLYRSRYEGAADRLADRSYDDVRPAYQLGHLAGRNPEYSNRTFDEVEGDLRRGWTDDVRARHGEWDTVRPYARDAYERGRSGMTAGGAAAGAANGYGASRGAHSAHEIGRDVSQGLENAWDETARGARTAGDRAADAADDLKDRVDGDPSSRPGRDATDRPGR